MLSQLTSRPLEWSRQPVISWGGPACPRNWLKPQPAGRGDDECIIPVRGLLFAVAEQFDGDFVRRVAIHLDATPEVMRQLLAPERYGFTARNAQGLASIAEHVGLEMTNESNYISVSRRKLGSKNYPGKRYWIDRSKVEAAGKIIHDSEEIARDLDRLIESTGDPSLLDKIKRNYRKSLLQDQESLIEGHVPASAIRTKWGMLATKGLRLVQVFGVALTAYDFYNASDASYRTKSIRPLAAESVRQVGGWGAGVLGMKIGGSVGLAFGLAAGGVPALVTTGVGAVMFGSLGYFGSDLVADLIYENEE